MFRFPSVFLFAFALALLAPVSLRAAESKPVSSWCDPVLKVTFPRKLAGLELQSRSTYGRGDLDYSLGYKAASEDNGVTPVDGEWLDVYVYTRVNTKAVQENVDAEAGEALAMVRRVMEANGASVSSDSRRFVQVWDRSGFTNSVALCEYAGEKIGGRFASVISVTAHAGRFIKLRYSVPTSAGDYVPARRFGEICFALDGLFAESARRANLDVYAAEGAEALLEKLRDKWSGAGERVSQWKMPGMADMVVELDAASRWCAEDYTNRIDKFANVSRRGIESKTDPETWYYNLACALSMQKRADDAFEALEQSVAAGFGEAEHAERDEDFANIKSDPRFARLVAAMRVVAKKALPNGVEPLHPAGGDCIVGEENVRYNAFAKSYRCAIDTTDRKTVVYIGNDPGRDVPCEGLLAPSFEEDADDSGAIAETACFHFSYDPDGKGRELWCPTIVASAAGQEDFFACIPAVLAANGEDANNELRHEQFNVLGVYAAKGFGADGTDPLPFWCPGFIAHSGGPEEGDKFAKLAADIVRAMPFEVIEEGFPVGQLVQKIVRSSQKGVEGEEGFKSGRAMRPVLDFADVDVDRAIAAAKSVDPKHLPPMSPYYKVSPPVCAMPFRDAYSRVESAHHVGVFANWVNRTGEIKVEVELADKDANVEWKVLAGDAGRVSFESRAPGVWEIRIDWHDPFDEEFPSGRRLKTARVDLGCFAVRDGAASMPGIVSVYFPPTQRREYDPDGRLRAMDYTGRKWPGLLSPDCPKGDWRDEPHYSEDGGITGWTRYRASEDGGVLTEEFTGEGLVVMTRDETGRPKRCRKDLHTEWCQTIPANSDAKAVAEAYALLSAKYDTLSDPPGGYSGTSLVWEYDYGATNQTEALHPVPPVLFRHRPELCPAADFGAESGFGLPLLAQMRIGYDMYSEYKAGRVPQPPSARTKLRFAKGVPSDKSRWPAEADEFEAAAAKHLYELADGACRATIDDGSGRKKRGGAEEGCFSVEWTRITMNRASEYAAFIGLNKFSRCSEDETMAALSSRTNDVDLAKVFVNNGPSPLEDGALPKGKSVSCAMWEITETLRFGVLTDFNSRFESRRHFFCVVGEKGEARTWDWFEEFPSRAIGDTMIMAACHDPDAVNNLAVLMHAGVCNPGSRCRPAVEKLLEFAAKGGCAAAAENLKALRGGNGEKAKVPPPPPELVGSMMGEYTQVCDIWDERWDLPFRERTPMRHVYCWNGAESTVRITATVEAQEGELKWKLIQGDPEKVRFTQLGNGTGSVRAEIDWHGAYLVRGRDGKARRTTRVEFGCVAVKDGLESEPCIVSVSASPHAMRVYDESGWLQKIDYRTPLLKDKVSARFPLGDWTDVFEYTPDGRLAGWTRLRTGENGAEEKERFTRDGLKVLTYDAIGRPLRCERDWRATLYQRTARGERSDHSGCVPEQFEYRYTGIEDFLGRPRRVSPSTSPSPSSSKH